VIFSRYGQKKSVSTFVVVWTNYPTEYPTFWTQNSTWTHIKYQKGHYITTNGPYPIFDDSLELTDNILKKFQLVSRETLWIGWHARGKSQSVLAICSSLYFWHFIILLVKLHFNSSPLMIPWACPCLWLKMEAKENGNKVHYR
jgi:hypothetical protein